MKKLLSKYQQYLQANDLSDVTINNYLYVLKQINKDFNADLTDFEAVIQALSSKTIPNRRNMVKSYRSFARFLYFQQIIPFNRLTYILEILRAKSTKRKPRVRKRWAIPKRNWHKIYEKAPNQVAKFGFWLGFNFGLRCAEIRHLRIEDIDFEENVILIRPHPRNNAIFQKSWRPKHNRSREIPFSKKQEQIFRRWINEVRPEYLIHPYLLFVSHDLPTTGSAISYGTFYSWCRAAGVRPHILRYSFASHYYFDARPPLNLKLLSDLLGHGTVATTSDYLHQDREESFNEARLAFDS
ncbi:MAG: tyrosine recombinase XerC [Candidatus Hodarchaeota archaeon]